mgnify:CR=1 FL=1
MVLLKNDGILPLNAKSCKTIAVIGPNADTVEILKGNYNGTATEHYTLLDGIRAVAYGIGGVPPLARKCGGAGRSG